LPLYEYQCKKCERRVEKIQKYSDPPLTTCEHCGGKLKRLISSSAIQFKGSGWYVNDYARGSSPGSKNSEGSDGGGKKAEDSSKKSESAESSSSKTAEPAKAPTSKPSEPSKTSKKD
jgi:putative FmdB family regulatory protein